MTQEHKPTFCRICEPLCGMIATVEDGRLTALRPDKDHPLSAGFACQKGVAFSEIVNDPDRVTTPLRRIRPNGLRASESSAEFVLPGGGVGHGTVHAMEGEDRFDFPRADCMSESGQTIASMRTIMRISTLRTHTRAILPTCRHFA